MSKDVTIKIKIEVENKSIEPYLQKICEEENVIIKSKVWKSRVNSYVEYEYEPFTPENYDIVYTLQSNSNLNKINFIKYLYDRRVKLLNTFNNNKELKKEEGEEDDNNNSTSDDDDVITTTIITTSDKGYTDYKDLDK